MPNITKQIHISYPVQLILRKFRNFAQQKKFSVIQSFQNQILIVQDRFLNRIKRFLRCLYPLYRLNSYRFQVNTDEYRSLRIISIQNLNQIYEDSPQLRQLLNTFSQQQLPLPQKKLDIEEAEQDIYSLQATSQYMFSKMLLEQNYSMGKKVNGFLSKFDKLKNSKVFQKSDIEWIEQVKDEIVHDMLQGFNCSRKELTQILAFCRMIVQGFLYERIMKNEDKMCYKQFKSKYFSRTLTELQKLNSIIIPYLILKQIYWIVNIFQFEYERQNDYTRERVEVLAKLICSIETITLKQKLKLLKFYTQINGQAEYILFFQKAYDLSRKK